MQRYAVWSVCLNNTYAARDRDRSTPPTPHPRPAFFLCDPPLRRFGGSMLASTPEFGRVCISKAQYNEEGPRCARASAVFAVTF